MKKTLLTLSLLLALSFAGHAQKFVVKTNALGYATFIGFGKWSPSPNLGLEIAICPHWTLGVDGYVNPFEFEDGKKSKFWAVQPELRYWFCTNFYGHFIGLHGQYSSYDWGMKKYNYYGWLGGAGLSYGYSLPIGYRWKVEATLGVGWNRVDNERTDRWENYWDDKRFRDPVDKDYFGITKAGINFVFVIK